MTDRTISASRFERIASALTLATLAVVTLHFTTRRLASGDVFWMVRAGEEILSTGHIPAVESWSYTVAGTPWNNHEWLFEALVALLHRAGGLTAIRLMVAVVVGAPLALLARLAWRRLGPAWAPLAVAFATVIGSFKLIPAPQTVSAALFAFAYVAFLRDETWQSGRRIAALGATLLVWANVTAEVVSFIPFVLIDAALCARSWNDLTRARRLALQVTLACMAVLITPSASSVLEYALRGTAVNRAVNAEFRALWEPAGTVHGSVKWLAVAVVLAWLARAIRTISRDGLTREWLRGEATAALACLGATLFERNLFLLVIPAASLARGARDALGSRARNAVAVALLSASLALVGAFAFAIDWSPSLAFTALTSREYWRVDLLPGALPEACLDDRASLPPGSRVYTSRLWASYVLWRRPDVKIFIDGRNREYPELVHRAARDIAHGAPQAPLLLEATGTERVVAPPGWSELPGLRGSGWAASFTSRTCVVYARPSSRR